MDFDNKYPNTKEGTYKERDLLRSKKEGKCVICESVYTKWQHVWCKRNDWGFPIALKKHVCSEECFDYYNIMKGLL